MALEYYYGYWWQWMCIHREYWKKGKIPQKFGGIKPRNYQKYHDKGH